MKPVAALFQGILNATGGVPDFRVQESMSKKPPAPQARTFKRAFL
jgi:hypothetical protein